MILHNFLKFNKFCRIVFHFPVDNFLFLSILRLPFFFQLIYFRDGTRKGFKSINFAVLETLKNGLTLKILDDQIQGSQKWHSVVTMDKYEDFF